jgi:hypothetical protein
MENGKKGENKKPKTVRDWSLYMGRPKKFVLNQNLFLAKK